jgi:hypothetical protein
VVHPSYKHTTSSGLNHTFFHICWKKIDSNGDKKTLSIHPSTIRGKRIHIPNFLVRKNSTSIYYPYTHPFQENEFLVIAQNENVEKRRK